MKFTIFITTLSRNIESFYCKYIAKRMIIQML